MRELIQVIFFISPVLIIYLIAVCNRIETHCKSLENKIDVLENIIKETDDHVDRLIYYSVDKDNEK